MIEIDQMDKAQLESSLILCFMSLSFMLSEENLRSRDQYGYRENGDKPPLAEPVPVQCYSSDHIWRPGYYRVPHIYADRMVERFKEKIVFISDILHQSNNPDYVGYFDWLKDQKLEYFKKFIEKEYNINFEELVEEILKNECIESDEQNKM